MPLEVIVVGAGICGLCTAAALHQAGHSVKIFEKSLLKEEVGSGVLITPNGVRVLSALGFDFIKAQADDMTYFEVFDGITLEYIDRADLGDPSVEFGAPLYTIHRVDLLNELFRLGSGVDVRLGTKVVGADAEKGFVFLEDGTCCSADLIVAADGVHSVLRRIVLPDHHASEAVSSGMSAFRFIIPTLALENNPHFQNLREVKGKGSSLFADTTRQGEHHMVWFTCRNAQLQAFVGIHERDRTNENDLKQLMLEEFGHFHPSIIEIIKVAPAVIDWPLSVYNPLPTWHQGKVVLAGDSAHPMLPLGAQGANQAIEDAGALYALFSGDVTVRDIESRLALYEDVRRLRASRIQTLSKVRLGRESDVELEVRRYADPPGSEIPTSVSERYKHDYTYDVFDACLDALNKEMLPATASL